MSTSLTRKKTESHFGRHFSAKIVKMNLVYNVNDSEKLLFREKQEGPEAQNRSPEYTGEKSNI